MCFRNRIENLVRVTERTEDPRGWVLGASAPRTWANRVEGVRVALDGVRIVQPFAAAQQHNVALDVMNSSFVTAVLRRQKELSS